MSKAMEMIERVRAGEAAEDGGHRNSTKTVPGFWKQWSTRHGWVDRVKGRA